MEDEYIKFANKLIKYRKQRGLKQIELANLLDVPANTYNQYENGTRKVPLSFITKVARFYQITIDELIDLDIHKENKSISSALSDRIEKEFNEVIFTNDEIDQIVNFIRFTLNSRGDD